LQEREEVVDAIPAGAGEAIFAQANVAEETDYTGIMKLP
jgi:hypothetical protein